MTSPWLAGERLVITGVDGFVGRHVARAATNAGATVVGISRSVAPDVELLSLLAEHHTADLRSEWPAGLTADVVIHLAGRAAVGPSFDAPQAYISDNSAITTTLCENLLALGGVRRLIGVSSGAVYAPPRSGRDCIAETDDVFISSPYVVSKLLVENQLAYYRTRGLDAVVARPFNHIGPGQGTGFLLPDLLARIQRLPVGEPLPVGNLSTARDYTDVRDIAAAYLALAAAPTLTHTTYNVASGSAVTGRELLETVCAGLDVPVPTLTVDPSFVRPNDVPYIAGSAARLRSELDWEARIPINRTVEDTITALYN